jgi:hypothetical protein
MMGLMMMSELLLERVSWLARVYEWVLVYALAKGYE